MSIAKTATIIVWALVTGVVSNAQGPNALQPSTQTPADQKVTKDKTGLQTPEAFVAVDDSRAIANTKLKDVGPFAETLLQLRLMPSMTVHRGVPPVHACGEPQQLGVSPQSQPPPTGAPSHQDSAAGQRLEFYQVSGQADISAEDGLHAPAITFRYSVTKCEGSGMEVVIPPHESSFTPDRALEELNGISAYILRKITSETRLAVNVSPCIPHGRFPADARLQDFVASIRTRIVDLLNDSNDFAVSDSANNAITCALSFVRPKRFVLIKPLNPGTDSLEAKISIQTQSSSDPYTVPEPVRGQSSLFKDEALAGKFIEDTAIAALDALRLVLTSERFGLQGKLDELHAATFLQQGKELLCANGPCVAAGRDRKGALLTLQAANKQAPGDSEILRYLGQAQNENRRYAEARSSLEEALKKLKSSQKGQPLEAEINGLLGDANLQLGASADKAQQHSFYSAAAQHYVRAAEIYEALDQPANAVDSYSRYLQAMKGANEAGKAVEFLLDRIQRDRNKGLHQTVQNTILQLSLPELESTFKKCDKAEAIEDECALLNIQRTAKLVNTDTNVDFVAALKLAIEALAFKPQDPQVRAEALAYAAMAALEVDRGQADRFLTEAEALPQVLSPQLRDWLVRLRAVYFLRNGNFEQAFRLAKAALREKDHTVDATLAAGEAALSWAQSVRADPARSQQVEKLSKEAKELLMPLVKERFSFAYPLLMQANHFLQQDNETKDLFLKIVDEDPRDDFAARTAMWVCSEWLLDFSCSFKVATKSSANFREKNPGRQLDYIEAAMLNGANQDADHWIRLLDSEGALSPDLKAVRDFYVVWLSFDRNDLQTAKTNFKDWRDNLLNLRENKKDTGWSFRGAKAILTSKSAPQALLMLGMIKALEDPTASMPDFPAGS